MEKFVSISYAYVRHAQNNNVPFILHLSMVNLSLSANIWSHTSTKYLKYLQ